MELARCDHRNAGRGFLLRRSGNNRRRPSDQTSRHSLGHEVPAGRECGNCPPEWHQRKDGASGPPPRARRCWYLCNRRVGPARSCVLITRQSSRSTRTGSRRAAFKAGPVQTSADPMAKTAALVPQDASDHQVTQSKRREAISASFVCLGTIDEKATVGCPRQAPGTKRR